MKTITKQIPNLLTLSNLLCGCLAIKYAFEWDLVMAAYLVGLACIFDFLDGFVARLLKVSGEMGKQLDSLADMVSFGVVPGVVMFQMMRAVDWAFRTKESANFELTTLDFGLTYEDYYSPLCYSSFLIIILSAYRLAKFNIDSRQTDKFIGLPTPANAIFILSIPLFLNWHKKKLLFSMFFSSDEILSDLPSKGLSHEALFKDATYLGSIFNIYFLIVITLIFSFLLIAELPLFALKFKNFTWSDNKIRFIFLTISLVMLIIFQVMAIPFIVILYILLSILNNLIFKQ